VRRSRSKLEARFLAYSRNKLRNLNKACQTIMTHEGLLRFARNDTKSVASVQRRGGYNRSEYIDNREAVWKGSLSSFVADNAVIMAVGSTKNDWHQPKSYRYCQK